MTINDVNSPQQLKHYTINTDTLEEHEDSQMSSLSFSDRDDFVYGINTMSEEEEEEEDKNSSISSEQTTPKKLTIADVQKKSLIMGRIFKKGGAKDKLTGDAGMRKSSATSLEAPVIEVPHKVAVTDAVVSKSATAVKSTIKDFDKLFDTLKNDAVLTNELQTSNESGSDFQQTGSSGEEMLVATIAAKGKLVDYQASNSDRLLQPGHKDFETTVAGTERLRRRRTGQQKVLTETWDSDEFEDFQTDDIMKLIDRTEVDEVADNTSSQKRMSLHRTPDEKIKSAHMECISDSDYEQSIKCKKVKRKLLENDIEANLKIEQLQTTLLNTEDSSILLTMSRRKRNAGDMLYYWSSSSDEELEKEEHSNRTKGHNEITKDTDRRRHCKPINNNNAAVGKKRGRKKKQSESTKSKEFLANDANKQDAIVSEKNETKSAPAKKSRTNTASTDNKIGDAISKTKKQHETEKPVQMQTLPVQTEEETCGTGSEHLQQHGWIMGDSHKKLVTMLAHAKGKHDSRKQSTTNRRK
uniref:Uncharacterized protein n=1 Tax=Anopheles culicifacies TaxID=139723 RepID=A0A182LVE7_9DIPT